ncbi:dCTP pyrophosphatase 1, partial [Chelydra serpentina]
APGRVRAEQGGGPVPPAPRPDPGLVDKWGSGRALQWRAEPEARAGLPGWGPGERAALAEELSDVLLYLVSLAQQCRVDLPRAALRKLDRNRARYPADRAHGSARKYTHYQEGPAHAQPRDGP